MLKKTMLILIILAIALLSLTYATEIDTIVKIDNIEIDKDFTPFIIEGSTYIPVRFISEKLNKSVYWDSNTYTVTLGCYLFPQDTEFINEKKFGYQQVNIILNDILLDTTGIIYNDITYAPLRSISEALGYKVGWNSKEKFAYLESPENNKNSFSDREFMLDDKLWSLKDISKYTALASIPNIIVDEWGVYEAKNGITLIDNSYFKGESENFFITIQKEYIERDRLKSKQLIADHLKMLTSSLGSPLELHSDKVRRYIFSTSDSNYEVALTYFPWDDFEYPTSHDISLHIKDGLFKKDIGKTPMPYLTTYSEFKDEFNLGLFDGNEVDYDFVISNNYKSKPSIAKLFVNEDDSLIKDIYSFQYTDGTSLEVGLRELYTKISLFKDDSRLVPSDYSKNLGYYIKILNKPNVAIVEFGYDNKIRRVSLHTVDDIVHSIYDKTKYSTLMAYYQDSVLFFENGEEFISFFTIKNDMAYFGPIRNWDSTILLYIKDGLNMFPKHYLIKEYEVPLN